MSNLIRVFLTGGIIHPNKLLLLLECLKKSKIPQFHLGSRQDILFKTPNKYLEKIKLELNSHNINYEVNNNCYKNISSSVISTKIGETQKWLDWSLFNKIILSLDFSPRLRINIVDPKQSLTPIFSGNLNFIASENKNKWYVYLRFSDLGTNVYQLPFFITSKEIPKFSKHIDMCLNKIEKIKSFKDILNTLKWKSNLTCNKIKYDKFLNKNSYIPNYEGLNRDQNNHYWLGLYFRKNNHNINIIFSMVKKCIENNEGVFGITSWKSFVIFNLKEKNCTGWIKLMGEWGMNLRHSNLDLNWHVPALDTNAYNLKKEIVKTLDENDVSNQGLSFSIIMDKNVDYIFTNVIIKKVKNTNGEQIFDVLYTHNFMLNTEKYNYFAKSVLRKNLPLVLVELSYFYFQTMKA